MNSGMFVFVVYFEFDLNVSACERQKKITRLRKVPPQPPPQVFSLIA